jgi:hypothetical protein
MSRVAVADLVEQVCCFTGTYCVPECVVRKYIDNETYKEVAIVEKSVVKQCVSCAGSVFVCERTLYADGAGVLVSEFASATICALIVSQLELECTESEGSRKSGSELGRYCGNKGPGCSLRKVLLTCALLSSMQWVAWFIRQVL